MTDKQNLDVYIASCDKDGGIYRYKLHADGSLELVWQTVMDRPMYMAKENNKMYIILRAPFEDSKESGLVVYDINDEGDIENPSGIISTKGEVACHLTVCDKDVYCVNYISGNVIKMPDCLVQHQGCGINHERQEGPHTHYVGLTPDKKYVCVTDLGLDTIFLYDKDLKLVSVAQVPRGHGVRHLIFSDDGKYLFAANELKSTVSAFRYDGKDLKIIDTVSCLPEDFTGTSATSAIRFNEGKIYVSNRGHDSIAVLNYENSKLTLESTHFCGGSFPRDFDIVGNYIISTNEKGDCVTVLDKNTFEIVWIEKDIKSPLCVMKL